MKSYARKQEFNLNIAKLRLQVESAHDAKEVFMDLGSCRAVCVYVGHGRPLFDEEHLAHLSNRAGLQSIQIHAAGDPLAHLIAAIPMDGTGAR